MLEVTKLNKAYHSFKLEDVSFALPRGYIMGFIGMNGAGKSTTLKAMLNIVKADSGKVCVSGLDMATDEIEIKKRVSFTLGTFDYYTRERLKDIAKVTEKFYTNWSEKSYKMYLEKFQLDENKKVFELSAGMKVKFALTLALSHNAELFIFDEPTSGLDPIARDELLDIFQEIVEDGQKSILFSTHITSDLDKCADYILFIKQGKIVTNSTKDDLIAEHAVVSGKKEDLTDDLLGRLIGHKTNSFGFHGLIRKENLKSGDKVECQTPNLEDIMVFYNARRKTDESIAV